MLYKKSYIMKNKEKTTATKQDYYKKFKENFYAMPEGNTCIAEPKLEA